MPEPVIAQKKPILIEVEEGKTYHWCACGRSAKQPFCDGSHKDTGFSPLAYKAEASRPIYFCACKQTKNQPMCDGIHKTL